MERTLLLLQPGVLPRRIAGEVLGRFERKGLEIAAPRMLKMDRAMAETRYAGHKREIALFFKESEGFNWKGGNENRF